MVTQTINDLYFVVSVRGIQIPASSLLKGGLAGSLGQSVRCRSACLGSCLRPAAPGALPRRAGEQSLDRSSAGWQCWAFLPRCSAASCSPIPTRNLVISFTGTSLVILGLAVLTPWVTVTLMRLLGEALGKWFGLLGRLAPRNVIRSQSRTAVAVAALMIAVSVTIGVQVMIASFRTTVTIWLEQTMRGDIYVSTQGLSANRLDTPLDPQVIAHCPFQSIGRSPAG